MRVFHSVFKETSLKIIVQDQGNKTATRENEEHQPFFANPFLAFVKSFTMFVGELEFSALPINQESNLMYISYLFFLAFVLLIVVVLMNLLNGLAVSDIRYE